MKPSSIRRPAACAVAALAIAWPFVAASQTRPAAIGSSDNAALAAQGFPLGGFRVYPEVTGTLTYDDNIFRRSTNRVADEMLVTTPSVAVRSQWSNHALDLNAYLHDRRFRRRTSQDSDDYGVSADGRLDVRRTTTLQGSASYSRPVQQRGTPGDLSTLTDRFVQYDLYSASASARQQINRVSLSGGISGSDYRYGDIRTGGIVINQRFRNRDVRAAFGRIDYQYSALTSLFVSSSVNRIRYRNSIGFDRASDGVQLLTGVHFELTRLLRGEVGVGYISQSFRNPRFADFKGLNYSLNLSYQPTPLTTVTLAGSRNLTDSALIGVVGVLSSNVSLDVQHELLRDLTLHLTLSGVQERYRGIDRTDKRLEAEIGARRRLNRYLALNASFTRQQRDRIGRFNGIGYTGNQFNLSLILSR